MTGIDKGLPHRDDAEGFEGWGEDLFEDPTRPGREKFGHLVSQAVFVILKSRRS
jgi:hypothetical protein